MFFSLLKDKCIKCNICSNVCVAGIISVDEETGFPDIDEKKSIRCISCGHCMAYCPNDACSVANLDESKFFRVDPKNFPSQIQSETFLRTRRSVRNFLKKDLSKSILEDIINIASTAPTSKNRQPVRWVIISNKRKVDEIGQHMLTAFQEKLDKCSDEKDKLMLTAMIRAYSNGKDVFMRGATALVVALTPEQYDYQEDGTIMTTYLELAAHSKGLGTCWAGYFMSACREFKSLRELSGIPEGYHIGGALLLGEPRFKMIKRAPHRKSNNIIWMD